MKKIYNIAFISIIIFNLILTLGCGNNKIVEKERAKACSSTIKALSAAVDLYNLDSFDKKVEPIKELNEKTFKLLVDNDYIKKDKLDVYKCPSTKKFEYISTYDLFEPPVTEKIDSFTGIKCKHHGTIIDMQKLIK